MTNKGKMVYCNEKIYVNRRNLNGKIRANLFTTAVS